MTSKDLLVLVADKNMEFAIRGILTRSRSIGIQSVSFDVFRHPERDPGCLRRGVDFLLSFANAYTHALILFDYDGCGDHDNTAASIEDKLEQELQRHQWVGCAAVVIDPELENWVWSDSPHVDRIIGWSNRNPPLRTWLRNNGYSSKDTPKPIRPKEALEAALREVRVGRTSSMYYDLAVNVSFNRCQDRSFLKLRNGLKAWFPIEANHLRGGLS